MIKFNLRFKIYVTTYKIYPQLLCIIFNFNTYEIDKDINKWEKEHGLKPILENNEQARIFSVKIKHLPLLPEEDIEAVFQRCYKNLIGQKDPILLPVDGKRQQIATLEKIFTDYKYYFEIYWLGVVKPVRISVFNQPKCTSNDIERYHRA